MNLLKAIIFIMLSMSLSGCYINTKINTEIHIKHHANSACINLLSHKLIGYNVRIIQEKNSVMLVLPSDQFFNCDSANFTRRAYRILDLITKLINCYDKAVISATGFDGDIGVERAHKVVQYLWRSGVGVNFAYVVYGKNKKLIGTNCVVLKIR